MLTSTRSDKIFNASHKGAHWLAPIDKLALLIRRASIAKNRGRQIRVLTNSHPSTIVRSLSVARRLPDTTVSARTDAVLLDTHIFVQCCAGLRLADKYGGEETDFCLAPKLNFVFTR